MTETDYRILKALANAGDLPVQSPAVIAYNLDKSRQYISERLSLLVDRRLVEKLEDGYYRITNDGRDYINRS